MNFHAHQRVLVGIFSLKKPGNLRSLSITVFLFFFEGGGGGGL